MDKLTAIKIKYDDGTYSNEIPVSVLSENVEWDNTHTLVDILGSIDVDVTGTIQDQISQLLNEKVSASAMQDYVTNSMPTHITNWLNTNVNPVGSAVVVDSSLTVSGAAADAKVTGDLKSAINSTVGKVIVDATHSYAGGSENWGLFSNMSAGTYAIKIYNNTDVSYEVAVKVDKWRVIKIITDNKWNIVKVPSNVDVTKPLVLTYRGNSAITTSVVVVKIDESLLFEISKTVKGTELQYGNYHGIPTSYGFNTNFSACPCKKADASGKVISLRIKNYASGTVEIYVGEVDQLYLFVPRTSFTINVDEGEKVYDVSDRNIFINEGEVLQIDTRTGQYIGRA